MKKITTREIFEAGDNITTSENYSMFAVCSKKQKNGQVTGSLNLKCQDGDEYLIFNGLLDILQANPESERYNFSIHILQSAFKAAIIEIKLGNPKFLHLVEGIDELAKEISKEKLEEQQKKETQSKYMSYLED